MSVLHISHSSLEIADMVREAHPPTQAQMERETALRHLAGALAEVLELVPDLPVIAIQWMHVKHPLQEVQETLVREHTREATASDRQGQIGWIGRMARCLVYAGYLSFHLIRLRVLIGQTVRQLQRQTFDIVTRTVCFDVHPPADGSDFYFGTLPQRLADQGMRTLLLCGNGTGGKWLPFAKGQAVSSGVCRIPELALVHPFSPFQMAAQQIRTAFRLRRQGRTLTPLARRVSWLASQECLSQATTLTGLLSWVGEAVVRTWHPRAVMTLYEGHAWEACLRHGVKRADPHCRTIGYQHTMIFRESIAMTAPPRMSATWSVPEVVLGLGSTPLELMRSGHAPFNTQMIPFGSIRYHAPGVQNPVDSTRRTILVTPEGIPSEIRTLFTFVAACAKQMPSYTFLLRCHPQIPMSEALQLAPDDLHTQPNVVLSSGSSIEEDFQRASVLLYRGSSSVIYGILHGLLPVYLDDGTADRDPIYAVQHWRRRCTSPHELAECLERHEQMSMDERTAAWQLARQEIERYTGPVTQESIHALLTTMTSHGHHS